MEFGKLSSIEKVDWTLPPNDPVSVDYLKSLSKRGMTRFYIGTPAWNHKEWMGKIYPPKTKPANFLSYYAQNFNTIELNTTHYGIPKKEKSESWLRQSIACQRLVAKIKTFERARFRKSILLYP